MNMFSPAEVAKNYVAVGRGKAQMAIGKMILLGILAGAFIAFGGVASTTVGVAVQPASLGKFLGAIVFPGGLTMVLLAGSELFTGNCLMVIPLFEKEIKVSGMIRNWVFVYIGNFIGALIVAAIVIFGHQASLFDCGVAVSAMSTAVTKCSMSFSDALLKGIACNFLVCIAVWISFAAKDVVSKIAGLFFPIMIFVLCGFEHSVANMYFISAGLFAKMDPSYVQAAAAAGTDTSALTWGSFLGKNLLPVTIGNLIGGAVLVGGAYWLAYLYKGKKKSVR